MLPHFNFWLQYIFLPWTYFQRFFSTSPPPGPYHLPAEWMPHVRTLMAWPDRISVDRDDQLHRAWTEVANVAAAIAKFEPVWLYASQENTRAAVPWIMSENVTVMQAELEQLWMRDTGPLSTQATNGKVVGLDLNYNYWGHKLSFPRKHDCTLSSRLLANENIPRVQVPFTSEGGALEVDGKGTLLATESSLLSPDRNPNTPTLTKDILERHFREYLNVTPTIWLPGAHGLERTDTHIDLLARFAANDTVVLSRPNKGIPSDNTAWQIYHEAREVLDSATSASGNRLKIVEIEEALIVAYARVERPAERLATSYVNYYLPMAGSWSRCSGRRGRMIWRWRR